VSLNQSVRIAIVGIGVIGASRAAYYLARGLAEATFGSEHMNRGIPVRRPAT
jgi:hypothetical protein